MKVVIAVLLLLAGGVAQDDVVKKIVPDADKIKKLTRKISKESRDKIEKALGEKLQDADLAPLLWECNSTVPAVSSMAKTHCLVTVVTVKGPKGLIKIGVQELFAEGLLDLVARFLRELPVELLDLVRVGHDLFDEVVLRGAS